MASDTSPTRFTERLNLLRIRFRPLGRDKPLTAKEISDGVHAATGSTLSPSAVKYLIDGERKPSLETARLLAQFFGVSTSFFTDDDVSAVEADLDNLELLRQMREAKVTSMAARMADLSSAEHDAFARFVGDEISRRGVREAES